MLNQNDVNEEGWRSIPLMMMRTAASFLYLTGLWLGFVHQMDIFQRLNNKPSAISLLGIVKMTSSDQCPH